ncbi:MAG TPA: hypothetical protein VK845_01425 [Gemmatimonadales bacterium]|nr:hypothetical protein [Gemmatimonadales bacterium]
MEGSYQTADLLVTGIIVAAFLGSIATMWAWTQSGVVWPWTKARPRVGPEDLAQLTEAVEELHARLQGVQEDLSFMHDRLERTERLLAPPTAPEQEPPTH